MGGGRGVNKGRDCCAAAARVSPPWPKERSDALVSLRAERANPFTFHAPAEGPAVQTGNRWSGLSRGRAAAHLGAVDLGRRTALRVSFHCSFCFVRPAATAFSTLVSRVPRKGLRRPHWRRQLGTVRLLIDCVAVTVLGRPNHYSEFVMHCHGQLDL